MELPSQRVERQQGETRGQVEGEESITERLANALPSSITTEHGAPADFWATAHRCTDLRKLGCALAWWLAKGHDISLATLNSRIFFTMYSTDVWTRAMSRHMALPIREGELWKVRSILKQTFFNSIFDDGFVQEWSHQAWIFTCCYAVNNLYGCARPLVEGGWNKAERRVVKAIGEGVTRLLCHGTVKTELDPGLEKELRSKRVNYQGEEVGTCHKLTFEQVLPSLPPADHGGAIDICQFVSIQTRSMLLNPGRCVLEDDGQQLPKLQGRVHAEEGHMERIADELVSRNVCGWIPLSSVFRFRGTPILNGLFGVAKSSQLEDLRPVLRLIMNLVPSNSIMRAFVGSVKNLPSITQWMTTVLEDQEELKIWQSDMCNAFYLFRLPPVWMPFLAFNILRNGSDVGLPDCDKVALACRVLPMGWISSVAIMQEISEHLLKVRALDETSQIVRNKAVPLWMVGIARESFEKSRSWWHVYLDNFAAAEAVRDSPHCLRGGDLLHQLAEDCWTDSGVLSSDKKRQRGVDVAQELGAFIDGPSQTIGSSPERLTRLAHATFWVLNQPFLSKKILQVILGRWVHVTQFRRPAMSFMNDSWRFISGKSMNQKLLMSVRRELYSLLCVIPLLHTFLGSTVSKVITASDASSKGGAVGIAHELSHIGMDYCNSVIGNQLYDGTIPVLVISLFNGIGGAFRVYDILGLRPRGLISFEIHKPANRITSRRWPHAEIFLDVRQFTRGLLRDFLAKYLGVLEIHLWAGFPCTDLSSVKWGRRGLDGPASGLIHEVLRIRKLIKEEIGAHIIFKEVIENVASMDRNQCERINNLLGLRPYFLECSDSVPMHRPRLCWTSESLDHVAPDIYIEHEEHWRRVYAYCEYPELYQWLQAGIIWEGGEQGHVLPTCMKAIPRSRPPPRPAGIQKCSQSTLLRYEADKFRYPPYQYGEKFVFFTSWGTWRLVSCEEKELLVGYGWDHTSLCFSASDIKSSPTEYWDQRNSLLGDSFSIFSFVIPGMALCRNFLNRPTYQQLCGRMGLAPGFSCSYRLSAPIARFLQYGFQGHDIPRTVQELNRVLLTRVNHTGSDIRISTGEILNPKAHPRQGVQADWWEWKPSFKLKWNKKEHINALELRSIFLAIRYHVTHLGATQFRIFHLTDSYICMSILGKGRSGSRTLQRILRQINAYLLSHGIHLILGHVESTMNPTDGESRSVGI